MNFKTYAYKIPTTVEELTSLICKAKVLNSHLPNVTSLLKTMQESIKGKAKKSKITFTPDMKKAYEKLIEKLHKYMTSTTTPSQSW